MDHKMLSDTLKKLGRYFSFSITGIIVFVMLIAGYMHGGIKGLGRIAAMFSLFFVAPLLLIQTGKLFKWIYTMIKSRQKTSYILSVVVLAFFAPSLAEAASTYEVYTYGNGDFLAAIFNGVAMMFNSGSILYGLIKIAAIILLLFAVVSPLAGAFTGKGAQINAGAGLLPMIQVPLIMGFVIYGVMTPKANLSIIDRQDPGQSQVISNVPLVHTYLAHAISTIGDKLGEEFETVFGQVDGLKFRNGGVGIGAKYTGSLMSIYPPNSSMVGADAGTTLITQVLREYFVRCVFPNFASLDGSAGATTAALDKLFTSENVPADLKASTTLFNSVHTTIMGITTEEANCQEAIDQVYDKWGSVSAIWLKDIETKLAGGVGSAGIVGNASINLGGGTLTETVKARYFPGSTLTSTEMLIHIATLNLMRDSVQSYLAVTGNPIDTATSLSMKQSSAGWLTSAKMLNTIVHTMRNLIEGLAYGLSVLLPVFFFVGSLSPLFTFAKILLWLQLWVPFYVVLNLFADMEYARAINNIIANEVAKGPTYRTYDLIATQTELTLGYVGAVSWSVPSFAWALVSGVSAGMGAVAGAISTGSGAQSSAQSTGGNIATGGATEMAKAEASRWGTSANVQTSMHSFDKTMQNYLGTKDSGVGIPGLRQTEMVSAAKNAGGAWEHTAGTATTTGKQSEQALVGGQKGDMNVATALGMDNMEDYKKWTAEGKNIDQDMADRLQKRGFLGAEAGMQMDSLSVGSDGTINSLTASMNDGNKSVSFKDGSVTTVATDRNGARYSKSVNQATGEGIMTKEEKDAATGGHKMSVMDAKTGQQLKASSEAGEKQSYQMNKEQASQFANYQDSQGHHDAATGIRDIANKLGGGETAQINTQMDNSGNLANAAVTHDITANHSDTFKETKGRHIHKGDDIRIGNDVVKGNNEIQQDIKKNVFDHVDTKETGSVIEHKDINTNTINHGPELKNAFFGLMGGDSAYTRDLASPSAPKEFDAKVAKLGDAAFNDMRDFLKTTGTSTGSAEGSVSISAGVGAKVFGIGAGAETGGKVSKSSSESTQVDLNRAEFDKVLRKASVEAWGMNGTTEEKSKHIADAAGTYLHDNVYKKGVEKTSEDFGADAPLTATKNGVDAAGNMLKNAAIAAGPTINDGRLPEEK